MSDAGGVLLGATSVDLHVDSPATVAFGLLAAVQLLSATAFLALGVTGVWPRLRGPASPLLGAAAVVLAGAEIGTGFRFGDSSGTLLTALRGAGALLLAAALYRGALKPPPPDEDAAPDGGPLTAPPPSAAVIAPLGALAPVAWAAAAAFAVAAVVAWSRPLRLRVPLVAGLALSGVAELLAPAARTSSGAAVQLLLLRGLAALCLLSVLVVLARASVLGRVASVIFTAVLLTATGAVAVAGTVTTTTLEREQVDTAERLHRQAQTEIDAQVRRAATTARQVAACPGGPANCPALVARTATVATIEDGPARRVAGVDDAAVLRALPRVPAVAAALRVRGAAAERGGSQLVLLNGRPARLLVVAYSGANSDGRRVVTATPYDVRGLLSTRSADLGVFVLPSSTAVATTFPPDVQARLLGLLTASQEAVLRSQAAEPAVLTGLRGRGRAGVAPLAPVVDMAGLPRAGGSPPVAVLAAAPRDDALVATQRRVLAGLFLALAATAVLVGLLSVALGAGVVRPIRRITDAARRVQAGELDAEAGPGGPDELGELARAFDAMTSSLTGTQEELRQTAEREAALRRRLSTVVDSLGDGLVVIDDDGLVQSGNPAARLLLGRDPVGLALADVLPAGDSDDQPVELEVGGEVRFLSVRRTALADGGGTVVLLRDRTRERQAERMKTEFLANVSHELRTPLTPVRGYAELLRRRRAATPDEVAEHAAVISAAADRMGRVVDLLVDVAAIDAGRVLPELTPLQVGPFLEQRLSIWWNRQPDRRDDLRGEWPPRLPSVSSDPRWLAKAIDELLDNALKYTAAGTAVRLEASRHGNRVRLAVRDAGRGLDETARPALYDDFAQADGSVTRARDGLGLGLPFVRRVAALFDVELVVESEPGHGALFALDVPLAPRPVPQRVDPGEGRTAPGARAPAKGVPSPASGFPLSGSAGGGTSTT